MDSKTIIIITASIVVLLGAYYLIKGRDVKTESEVGNEPEIVVDNSLDSKKDEKSDINNANTEKKDSDSEKIENNVVNDGNGEKIKKGDSDKETEENKK